MSTRADMFIEVAEKFEQERQQVQTEVSYDQDRLADYNEQEMDYQGFYNEIDNLDLDEGLNVKPGGFRGDVYYVEINGESFGYKCDSDTAKKFEKMVTFGSGFKALNWLKQHSQHVSGGKAFANYR